MTEERVTQLIFLLVTFVNWWIIRQYRSDLREAKQRIAELEQRLSESAGRRG